MEKWFTPIEASALPAAQKVLVIAPHPDDEVFGCGGAIACYAQSSVPVHVHILTDGAGYAPDVERSRIREIRNAESTQALATLGQGISCDFGKYQDRSLLRESGLITHLLTLLEQQRPQLVIAPSFWEIHPDHQACARAVLAAVQQWQRMCNSGIGVMFYEIGSPLRTNFLLDITEVWTRKEQAMRCFDSQMQQQDYLRHIKGLNTYRTYTLPAHIHYAEAYHYLTVAGMGEPSSASSSDMAQADECMNRWVESALHSASVHAEDLQQALFMQQRHSEQLVALHIQQQHDNQHLQQELFARVHALEEQLRSYEQAIQNLRNSTSWRLTAPLRSLGTWLGKRRPARNGDAA